MTSVLREFDGFLGWVVFRDRLPHRVEQVQPDEPFLARHGHGGGDLLPGFQRDWDQRAIAHDVRARHLELLAADVAGVRDAKFEFLRWVGFGLGKSSLPTGQAMAITTAGTKKRLIGGGLQTCFSRGCIAEYIPVVLLFDNYAGFRFTDSYISTIFGKQTSTVYLS